MRPFLPLLAGVAAASLCSTQAQQPALLQAPPTQPASCPVDLSVRQHLGPTVTRTSNETTAPPAQQLEILFKQRRNVRAVDAIEIRVRGVGSKPQTLLLSQATDGSGADDLQQTFLLRRIAGTPTLTHSDIRVPGMNAIRWVELVSVTYTDGTTWHPTASLACRAEPNRLLLIAERN